MIRTLLIVVLVLAPQLAFALGRNEPAPARKPVTYLTNPKTARKVAAVERVKVTKKRNLVELTDEELAVAAGIKANGTVDNATAPAFTFTLDSFAAWMERTEDLKVGVSLGDERLTWYPLSKDHPVTLTLDISDDLVGGSLNFVFIPVIRLALGVGYGRLFDIDENTWYVNGRVRLW